MDRGDMLQVNATFYFVGHPFSIPLFLQNLKATVA